MCHPQQIPGERRQSADSAVWLKSVFWEEQSANTHSNDWTRLSNKSQEEGGAGAMSSYMAPWWTRWDVVNIVQMMLNEPVRRLNSGFCERWFSDIKQTAGTGKLWDICPWQQMEICGGVDFGILHERWSIYCLIIKGQVTLLLTFRIKCVSTHWLHTYLCIMQRSEKTTGFLV